MKGNMVESIKETFYDNFLPPVNYEKPIMIINILLAIVSLVLIFTLLIRNKGKKYFIIDIILFILSYLCTVFYNGSKFGGYFDSTHKTIELIDMMFHKYGLIITMILQLIIIIISIIELKKNKSSKGEKEDG